MVFADSALTPGVRVSVRDAAGTLRSTGNWPVELSLASPNGASLGGTLTATTSGGTTTFANARIDRAGSYLLRVTSTGTGAPAAAVSASSVQVLAPPAIMSPGVAQLLSDSSQVAQGMLTYRLVGAGPKLAPGSVVVGPEFGGYLRKVRTVQQVGSTLTLQTDPAALTDAVREGSVTVSELLGVAAGLQPTSRVGGSLGGGASFRGLVPGVTVNGGVISVDNVVLWGTASEGLVIRSGSIGFDPAISLRIALKNFAITSLEAKMGGVVTVDLPDIWLGTPAAVSATLPSIPIATFSKPFLLTVGGWPVYGKYTLTWSLEPEVGASGEASLATGVRASGGVSVGARWTSAGWEDLTGPTATFEVQPITVTARAGAYAKVRGKAELRVTLYGVLGPSIAVAPWLKGEVTADLVQNQWASSCSGTCQRL